MTEKLKLVGQPQSPEEQPPSVPSSEAAPIFHMMDRTSRGSYFLMPQLLERIGEFEERGGTRGRAARLPELFEKSFCSDAPWMVCAVYVLGGRIVAHALGSLEHVLGEPYLYVAQLEADKDCDFDIGPILAAAVAWGRQVGVIKMLAYPAGEGQQRLFRRYGMKPVASTMALDLTAAPYGKE